MSRCNLPDILWDEMWSRPANAEWNSLPIKRLRLDDGAGCRRKSAALNAALPQIDTGIVIRRRGHDDPCRSNWTDAPRISREPAIVAAAGVLVRTCAPTAGGHLFEWFQTRNMFAAPCPATCGCALGLLLISGASGGMQRTAVLEAGGFEPDCQVEDDELVHRLKRYSVLEGLPALTNAPSSVTSFLSQRRRWLGDLLQEQYRYREMVGNGRCGATRLAMPVGTPFFRRSWE
jgi:hypothetical protein